jgi:hypothetical protein
MLAGAGAHRTMHQGARRDRQPRGHPTGRARIGGRHPFWIAAGARPRSHTPARMARPSGWSSQQSPRVRRLCRRAEFCAQRALSAAGSSASDTVIRITRSSTAAIRIDVGVRHSTAVCLEAEACHRIPDRDRIPRLAAPALDVAAVEFGGNGAERLTGELLQDRPQHLVALGRRRHQLRITDGLFAVLCWI